MTTELSSMKNLIRPFQGEAHKPFHLQGDSPAALLVHGFPGSPAELRPLGNLLQQMGWTVSGPLLPGFGPEIETLFERRWEEWASTVENELVRLRENHQPIVLIGYSMGSALALTVAVSQMPTAVVLLAPFWQLGTILQRMIGLLLKPFIKNIRPFKRADFSDPQLRYGLTNFIPGVNLDDPATQQQLRDLVIPTAIFEQLGHMGQRAYQLAHRLRVPTLVIQGSEDKTVTKAQTLKLLKRLNGPTKYVEVAAGHDLLHATQPAWQAVSQTVLDFLEPFGKIKS